MEHLFKWTPASRNSLRAFAQEIKKELSGGLTSDDNTISLRHIETAAKHIWGNIQKIEDEVNEQKGIHPSPDRYKTFTCLSLEDSNDFNCQCKKYGGKFKKAKFPAMMSWKGKPFVSYVGILQSGLKFTPVKDHFAMNAIAAMVNKPQYFIVGDSMYFSIPKDYSLICTVDIIGVPDDPSNEGDYCFDVFSEDWKCKEYMKARIKSELMASFGRNILTTTPAYDYRNNGQHGNQFVTTRTP